MDAHSRLRKRLQDSSVRVAAGSGEGVGGVHDFSASPIHLGGPCDLMGSMFYLFSLYYVF